MSRITLLVLLMLLVGCSGNSGPPSVSETSASRAALADRVEFIEQYVSFRRKYNQLEYDVSFTNGGSFPPAPSEWDIRIVASVNPDDVDQWAIAGKRISGMATPDWVGTTAKSLSVDGVSEWYRDGVDTNGRTVGIDRDLNIVVYRIFAH